MDIKLGTGVLTWDKDERVSDRYGAVWLRHDGRTSLTAGRDGSLIDEAVVTAHVGETGNLIVHVLDARQSTHIGDLFHGIFPRTPEVGQVITLGEGTLFTTETYEGGIAVGLKPADGRDTLWLDMRALYDSHEQLVDLVFHPIATKH